MAEANIPLTKEGSEALHEELRVLKSIERPKVIQSIADARAHGDLSENADYSAARERQGMIEARIAELEDKLSRSTVIDFTGQDGSSVKFGAFVTVIETDNGEEKRLRIVGDLEADIQRNKISISSPLARALMGKKTDDIVEVQAPRGVIEYTVGSISY